MVFLLDKRTLNLIKAYEVKTPGCHQFSVKRKHKVMRILNTKPIYSAIAIAFDACHLFIFPGPKYLL